jgi:hypothetical protein
VNGTRSVEPSALRAIEKTLVQFVDVVLVVLVVFVVFVVFKQFVVLVLELEDPRTLTPAPVT